MFRTTGVLLCYLSCAWTCKLLPVWSLFYSQLVVYLLIDHAFEAIYNPLNESLDNGFVLVAWKNPTVIPVPKTSHARELERRPLTLTSVLCKCMGCIVCKASSAQMKGSVDPVQFAYFPTRSTMDASLTLIHKA